VGVAIYVFDDRAAPTQLDRREWIKREVEVAPKYGYDSPKTSSPRLRRWFEDMRNSFPLIGDAHPDDPFGTEYCFFGNVIDANFASSVGEQGILEAWRIAEKHGLRLLAGDELLPQKAPKGGRDFHIAVLDGRKPDTPGLAPNMCFVVFDPDISHVAPKEARTWVLQRLKAGPWSKDQSILTEGRLKECADQFATRSLDGLVLEMRFYRELIFIRVDKKNGGAMLAPTIEISRKHDLPFEVFVNLDLASPSG